MPKARAEYWRNKFARNVERDRRKERALMEAGWRVVTVWECETRDRQRLEVRLREVFGIGVASRNLASGDSNPV